jgi:hypothetical protein
MQGSRETFTSSVSEIENTGQNCRERKILVVTSVRIGKFDLIVVVR